MPRKNLLKKVIEPEKEVPVLYDADVVVAGAGTSGIFAALAAAKTGASTVLIDQFGCLGGNIGSSLITMGTIDGEAKETIPGGLKDIPKDFISRISKIVGSSPNVNANVANTASIVARTMMKEYGVKLLMHTTAADPIMKNDCVQGLFVETNSGRRAIKAKVTVDATGNAEIAFRAGVPIIKKVSAKNSFAPIVRGGMLNKKFCSWNDTVLKFFIANVDTKKYESFINEKKFVKKKADIARFGQKSHIPGPLMPLLRKAEKAGEFQTHRDFGHNIYSIFAMPFDVDTKSKLAEGFVSLRGEFDVLNPIQMSKLELNLRDFAFDAVTFFRKRVSGFKNAYLLFGIPFLGARGGPCIKGEHTLTPEESIRGQRFDDVIFVNTHEALHGGAQKGYDVPYGILLPQNIDGLLVTGRGAAYIRRGHDPSGLRARPSMMMFGETAGISAGLCVKNNVSPKKLDRRLLQKKLVQAGFYLGNTKRLRELGLLSK